MSFAPFPPYLREVVISATSELVNELKGGQILSRRVGNLPTLQFIYQTLKTLVFLKVACYTGSGKNGLIMWMFSLSMG